MAYIYLDFIDIDNFSILDWDVIDILDHKHNNEIDQKRTITELIGIPDKVKDGKYLLNISLANIENDASPSRPIIYEIF